MIGLDYACTMARYNRWQNRSLIAAASGLADADRWRDRGAFFESIAGTLNHIHWGDERWLARLSGKPEPEGVGARSHTEEPRDWTVYVERRAALDDAIVAWADGLRAGDLEGTVTWRRGEEPTTRTMALCVVQFFNHQTHHRGQVHAMLTAAGAVPEPTDVVAMPDRG